MVNWNFASTESIGCTVMMCAFISEESIVHFQIYSNVLLEKNKPNYESVMCEATFLLLPCLNQISLEAIKYWKYFSTQVSLVTRVLFKCKRFVFFSSLSRCVVSLQFFYITTVNIFPPLYIFVCL